MDITPYLEGLRRDLTAVAATGDEQVRAAAERLVHAIEPAARLAMMEAISHAAAEITSAMPAGGVDVRLDGRDLDFVVDAAPLPPTPPAPPAPPLPPATPDTDEEGDGALARITLRLPESVKTRAEELAARSGSSLNTWLVTVLRAATSERADRAVEVDLDLTSLPFGGRDPRGRSAGARRMTGWI